jgi:phage-related protein
MPTVGKGAEELRIWTQDGTFRVLYVARFVDVVYVLHAFQKRERSTPRSALELARQRYKEAVRLQGARGS